MRMIPLSHANIVPRIIIFRTVLKIIELGYCQYNLGRAYSYLSVPYKFLQNVSKSAKTRVLDYWEGITDAMTM